MASSSAQPSSLVAQRASWARRLSASACLSLTDPKFSGYLDHVAFPGGLRAEFRFPKLRRPSSSPADGGQSPSAVSADSLEPGHGVPDDLDSGPDCVYLCGNSLGLQNRRLAEMLLEELDVWAHRSGITPLLAFSSALGGSLPLSVPARPPSPGHGSVPGNCLSHPLTVPRRGVLLVRSAVRGHFDHPYSRNWSDIARLVTPTLASLAGASSSAEVACTGTLTTNLHILMTTFYRPTSHRYKILFEAQCFPSDLYAFASQAQLHGIDPQDALLALSPRPGEFTLRTEDILSAIHREGHLIALILFPGVQYYTGQAFPMKQITTTGHQYGCIVGFDLAHAIGNIVLELHAWKVDFAVWCSYKYLNGGPGAIAGLFVHSDWFEDPTKLGGLTGRPRLAGWFGHNPQTRFQMPDRFDPIRGAEQFVHSNPDILSVVSLHSSLQLFANYPGGLAGLRSRSEELTGYLEICLRSLPSYVDLSLVSAQAGDGDGGPGQSSQRVRFTIITPSLSTQRGSQLSLMFLPVGREVMDQVCRQLSEGYGIVGDERKPDVLRLAPVAMYNSFEDCRKTCETLDMIIKSISLSP